ncbi:MAG: histidine phosphatase family protein [Bacteroidia bacterium]
MCQYYYIIRHAETALNAAGVIQGQGMDVPLSPQGRKQARALYDALREIPFQAVIYSPLRRAEQTVEPFLSKYPGLAMPQLKEISWGVLEGAPPTPHVQTLVSKLHDKWQAGLYDAAAPGGESPQDVQKRVLETLHYLQSHHPKGNILICTHGRTLRILLATILGYELRCMHLFAHSPGALNLLVRLPSGYFYALRLNDTHHLIGS